MASGPRALASCRRGHLASVDPRKLPHFISAFRDETAAAGRLDHPGIVAVFDHDADARPPFIVMSLVRGGTLRDLLGGSDRRKRLR